MDIRRATPDDATAIAAIIVAIIREGTTYTLDPDMSGVGIGNPLPNRSRPPNRPEQAL